MWIKIMGRENMGDQYMVIAAADKITDEFKIIGTRQPLGYSSGDFDLAVDENTQKAYIFFDKVHDFVHHEHPHKDIVCAELTDDYTDLTGTIMTILPIRWGLKRLRYAGETADCICF